jgi:hypothetical protein
MTAVRRADESHRTPVRAPCWLPALEQELRSRVGWADEAVSPFAGARRLVQAPAKLQHETMQTGKAA